ncbi:MAG TPA: enoyl-CoA hydratase/isomerase family protein [Methylomirabilota bacterium]|jgi:enoyl-CoA hydratase/carnithine racemase|nr:enoyl-CoA hydratase/isomerase family protein [Methylomirabilota bacterium]
MTEPSVLYEVKDGVASIVLNRPRVLNALDLELSAEFADAAEQSATDDGVWVVVVRGAGRAFSSGMDRTALSAGRIGEPFYRHWIRGLNCLEDMPKLVIAVCHGYCIGGGLQLAVACDVRLATEDCVLGLGATEHGLIPDGSILRLARIIGMGRAKELTLLNDHVRAEEARNLGLVNWVVAAADLEAKLRSILDRAFRASRTATGHAKRLLQQSFHADPRTLIEDVLSAQADCMTSWEIREANRAWDDKRPARYYPPPDR